MPSTFRGEQTLNAQVGNYITDTPNCPKIGGSGWNMYFKSGANIKHFIRVCTPFFPKSSTLCTAMWWEIPLGPLFEVHVFFFQD